MLFLGNDDELLSVSYTRGTIALPGKGRRWSLVLTSNVIY